MGLLILLVIIPAQHIPPMMSSVSPDFYPRIGTVILLVGGLGMMFSGWRGAAAGIDSKKIYQAVRFCTLMAVLFTITLMAFQWVHFLAGGWVLVVSTMWLLGERRPFYLGAVSLVSPFLIWLFIHVLLGRTLP